MRGGLAFFSDKRNEKIQLVSILIIALLFPISRNADKDKDVSVKNTPMMEVVNTEPVPTVVNDTPSNPIPETMNGCNSSEMVSTWKYLSPTPQTFYTVPENKTFILTCIF